MRVVALTPLVAAAVLPWATGDLDNTGATSTTLPQLDRMRYDDARPLFLAVLLCLGALMLAWSVAVWALRDGAPLALRAAVVALSVAGPPVLVLATLAYCDPSNDASPAAGLWIAAVSMPVVGLIALCTAARRADPGHPARR